VTYDGAARLRTRRRQSCQAATAHNIFIGFSFRPENLNRPTHYANSGIFTTDFASFRTGCGVLFTERRKKKHDRKIDASDPFPGQHLCVGLGTVKAVSANRDPKTTQKHEKHHPNAQKNIKTMHNYYDRFKAIG